MGGGGRASHLSATTVLPTLVAIVEPSPAAHPDRPIYHLALAGEWQDALDRGGPYRWSTVGRSLDEEGFIHCCFAEQVPMIADRYYAGRDDVVVLTVDPARVGAEIRVEAVPGGDRFPHIYGPLPVEAVVAVTPVAGQRAQ